MPKRYIVTRQPGKTPSEHRVTFEPKGQDKRDPCKDLPKAANVTAAESAEMERLHPENPSEWECAEVRKVLPRVDHQSTHD